MDFIFKTNHIPDPGLAGFIEQVRDVDWAATSLGPMDSWPQDILQLCHLILLDPAPRLLMLGPEHLYMFYNQAYVAFLVGDRHPEMLGMPVMEAWGHRVPESTTRPIHEAIKTGLPSTMPDVAIYAEINGTMAEVLLSFTLIPIAGAMGGLYSSMTSVTETRLAEQRGALLRDFGVWSTASDLPSLWQMVLDSFSADPFSFPFALLYSSRHVKSASSAIGELNGDSNEPVFWLEGALGDFNLAEETKADISNRVPVGFHKYLRKALAFKEPVLINCEDRDFPSEWRTASQQRGWEDPCSAAIVHAIRSNRTDEPLGLLVMGLSTRRRYDDAHKIWLSQVVGMLVDCATRIVFTQDEARRRLENAQKVAHEQNLLNEALAMSKQQASTVTGKFDRIMKIVDMMDVGIFEYHPDGTLMEANHAFFELSGISSEPAQWKDHPFIDRLHPDDADMVMVQWQKMSTGTPVRFEMRWKPDEKSPGDDRWVLAACVPVKDDNGDTVSIYGCTTDISAQKRSLFEFQKRSEALERARVLEHRFRTLTESAPVAIGICDAQGAVIFVNERWWQVTGHARTSYDKIDWMGVVHEDDKHLLTDAWEVLSTTLGPVDFQFRLKSNAWVQYTAVSELDSAGSFAGVIGSLTDISHLKWAEAVQILRLEEAMEAKRQQENFIDMTSHEIRNPLGAVVHCAESLAESLMEMTEVAKKFSCKEDEVAKLQALIEASTEAVNTIISCSDHQRRIVDDILVASKLDSKLLQIAPSNVRISEILRDIHKMFVSEAQKVGVGLKTEADLSLASIDWVYLDVLRIKQILINLVTNALKFTKQQAVRQVHVMFGASRQRPTEAQLQVQFATSNETAVATNGTSHSDEELYLWFIVKDTGRGMTLDERHRIFSRFAQGSPRTYGEYGGSGLGLFISRELARLQGGEIGVASHAGVGSSFAFYVQTHHSSGLIDQTTLEMASTSITTVTTSTLPNTTAKRTPSGIAVLVVEDNLVNQKVLQKRLSKLGYTVHVADNGIEAIDFLKTSRRWQSGQQSDTNNVDAPNISIVLMDVFMPIMDGLTCTRQIRDLERQGQLAGHLPIIAVSANARIEQREQAVSAGMDATIAKPFQIADLTPLIERLVGG